MKQETVEIEPGILESAIEKLADCAQLEQVQERFGADTVSGLVAELNACLRTRWRVDLSSDMDNPARRLAGAQLERFEERLRIELGVRQMGVVDATTLTPSDRPPEQLIAERLSIIEAEARSAPQEDHGEGVEAWLRLPSPSATYDLDAGLGDPLDEGYDALRGELRQATLAAIRACIDPKDWIYVVHEPEFAYGQYFRVWPHRQDDRVTEHFDPVPDGDDQVLLAQDFGWGIYATWSFDQSVDEALSVFGRPLLEAFATLQPRALSRLIRVDGEPV